MREILDELDVKNPQVIYYGWQPGGASAAFPTRLRLERALGDRDDLRSVADEVSRRGGTFALYLDPTAALREEPRSYSRYDLAMAITGDYLRGHRRGKPNYYFNFQAMRSRFTALSRSLADQNGVGLALDGISDTLYSDFRRGATLNREETIAAYRALLEGSPVPLALYRPNDYLFAYARAVYDVPITDNGYIFTTQT
ncbi:MAG: DUF5696 domain-containing protein, partial [Thermus sp.]|uniref:DUF5696 domain-containing protein n=1 Tax=Thermus sp. TaxID=275 RepID=UPI0025F1C779